MPVNNHQEVGIAVPPNGIHSSSSLPIGQGQAMFEAGIIVISIVVWLALCEEASRSRREDWVDARRGNAQSNRTC